MVSKSYICLEMDKITPRMLGLSLGHKNCELQYTFVKETTFHDVWMFQYSNPL